MARNNGTDSSFLEAALIGYQHQLTLITAKLADVRKRLGGRTPIGVAAATTNGRKPVKRQMSAEGRARIAAAQKRRWAAARKAAA